MEIKYIKIAVMLLASISLGIMTTGCNDKHSDETEHHDVHDHENEGHDHGDEEGDEHEGHDHSSETGSHEGHDHSSLIELSEENAKRFGVKTEIVEASEFHEIIKTGGRIESTASDEGIATATRSGILTLSPNINAGVSIGAGTTIGTISSSHVQGGDPTVQAIAVRDAAKRELDRLKPLHDDGIVSTEEYNAALRAYEEAVAAVRITNQGSSTVKSPKSGVITQLLAQTGEYVETGRKIAVVSGNTRLTLKADVPERYINRIVGIESANFRSSSSDMTFNLDSLDGKLLSAGNSGVASNGYIPVFFSFRNNGSVAPGSFAEVYLKSGKRDGIVSVPKEAIVEISGTKCVYSAHGSGHYIKHVVELGASDGKRVEIRSGLAPGEEVVVQGAQAVRMAETSATAVPGHTHNH